MPSGAFSVAKARLTAGAAGFDTSTSTTRFWSRHGDVGVVPAASVGIEEDAERLAPAQIDAALELAEGGRGGAHVVDEERTLGDARDEQALAVGRERRAPDAYQGTVLRLPSLAGGRVMDCAILGDGAGRGVELQRLEHAVVGGDVDEVGRHEGDGAMERLRGRVLHVAQNGIAAADLGRIDDAHRVVAVARVDGDDEARAGEARDHHREAAREVLLGEDPVGAGGTEAVAVGEEGRALIGAGVARSLAGGEGARALAGHDRGVLAVPVAARHVVGDGRVGSHSGTRVGSRELGAVGARALVGAGLWRPEVLEQIRRRHHGRRGIGAAGEEGGATEEGGKYCAFHSFQVRAALRQRQAAKSSHLGAICVAWGP